MIWDTAIPGFCVRVTDKGAASYSIMRRCKRKVIRRTIGLAWHVPFPASQPLPYPLADAREDARGMLHDIARGIDPKTKREAALAAEAKANQETFGAVAELFIAKHVRKLRSCRHVEAAIRRELIPALCTKPVAGITRRDIVQLLEAVVDSGRAATARHLLAHLSKFYAWAISRDCYDIEASPCSGIRAADVIGELKPRQRVLVDSELAAFWRATAAISRLLLLAGQRLREVSEVTWQEIDLGKRLWTIPADRMKNDTAHVVPLAPEAVAILESLPRWTGSFIFSTTGGRRPIADFSGVKKKFDALMPDVDPWRFHDIRRTMRTGMSALRVPDTVSELCIAHTQKGLHKTYDQHAYLDEKRRAFEAWATYVLAICEPGAQSNVISIAAR